jgi:hypothetical protein
MRILYFTIRGLFFVDPLSWFLDVVEGKLLIKDFSASLSFLLRSLRFG